MTLEEAQRRRADRLARCRTRAEALGYTVEETATRGFLLLGRGVFHDEAVESGLQEISDWLDLQESKPAAGATPNVKDGESTTWLRVATFSETAIKATADLKKGTSVYVEGSLRQTEWKDREGQARTGLEVMAWRVEPLALLGHRRPAKEAATGRERAAGPHTAGNESGRQASAKREWQRPADTDPRPAGGAPADDVIPF